MISVHEADALIASQKRYYGTENVLLDKAQGRMLAAPIIADRDLPPFDRATMDGIAIGSDAIMDGVTEFHISGTIPAGSPPLKLQSRLHAVEIMTGAPVPPNAGAVVPFEHLELHQDVAKIKDFTVVTQGQNIHYKGSDRRAGEILVDKPAVVSPAEIAAAATVGVSRLIVYKLPRVAVVTTGDELIAIDQVPENHQIRQSNGRMLAGALQQAGIKAATYHLPDDQAALTEKVKFLIGNFDVVITTGAVSAGRHDYLPAVLEQCGVRQLFHKVKQRPGKPFWMGVHSNSMVVFAFPGNPVSCFLCFHRYFLPWLYMGMGIARKPLHAILQDDVTFLPDLQYFMQVVAQVDARGRIRAAPLQGNGSGDLSNLAAANAFLELPAEKSTLRKGSVYRLWPFKEIF